jgi:hypothetical protein
LLSASWLAWLTARYAAIEVKQKLIHQELVRDTIELREALVGIKAEDLADVEIGVVEDLKRLALIAADSFLGNSDDEKTFYVDEPVPAPDEYHFNLQELEEQCQDEAALKELLKRRIKELAGKRKRVKHGYMGITVFSPARWSTYKQCRKSHTPCELNPAHSSMNHTHSLSHNISQCVERAGARWRVMQEAVVIHGIGASDIIGLLEELGIEALQELQQEAANGCGKHHTQFGNRTAGGEGVVRGARYYVLYFVTEDDGAVE